MSSSPEYTLTTFSFDPESHSFHPKSISKPLPPTSILIETTHSGICYTDVHAKSSGCGLGHEGIGFIRALGSSLSLSHFPRFHLHDRVGWGWLHTSCSSCETCRAGYRQYCASAKGFGSVDRDQGACGDFRIIDAAFAYAIPEKIPSELAAPLMCAGASVFEALHAAGTTAGQRVGVVGIGGLGHVGVLFARAMGCAVTAISSGKRKREDAWTLGADEFRDAGEMGVGYYKDRDGGVEVPEARNIDVLLITSNAVPKLEAVLPLLARRATIVLMTIQQEALEIPYMSFVLPGHRLIASTEASVENHVKMLDFVAEKNIKPWIETFDMDADGVAKAFARLESGEMRYRGVLVRQKN